MYSDNQNKKSLFGEWLDNVSLENNSVLMEIGAFNGTLSKYLCDNHIIDKAFAIEASKSNYSVLCESTSNYKNIIPLNFAIGDKDGESTFFESEVYPNCNSILEGNPRFKRELIDFKRSNIYTLKLSSLIKKQNINKIDLLILNCEGAEKFILNDIITNNLYEIIKNISVEFHPHLYGQLLSIKLIQKFSKIYYYKITKTNLRGPINVIFYSANSNKIKKKIVYLTYLKLRAFIFDLFWPVLNKIRNILNNFLER